MPRTRICRLNRWAFAELVARDPRSKSEIARDSEVAPSTLTGLLSGRRDASDGLVVTLAAALGVQPEALLCDPAGAVPPLLAVLREAEGLVAAGVDGGLRRAVVECHRAGVR